MPVEAQAAVVAPVMRAWVAAAVMPLSLKLPDGLSPSYCSRRPPGFRPAQVAQLLKQFKEVQSLMKRMGGGMMPGKGKKNKKGKKGKKGGRVTAKGPIQPRFDPDDPLGLGELGDLQLPGRGPKLN